MNELVSELESIEWSEYSAAHGDASKEVEDDVKEDKRTFFKKLFSGPPPKEKVGTIKDFLLKLHSEDSKDASDAYKYFASVVCRNEFVTSAALPSYPFLKSALIQAKDNSNHKVANLIIELIKAFYINLMRLAIYPKGKWAETLKEKIKDDLAFFKEQVDVSELKEIASELVELLEKEPAKISLLDEEISWLEKGEIRLIQSDSQEELVASLERLDFKVYLVDCGNIEMEMELINNIASSINLSADELNPVDNWGWNQFIDSFSHEFSFDNTSHVAIVCTGLDNAIDGIPEVILNEFETLVMALQHRDDTIFDGPVQKEFFFLCGKESISKVVELKNGEAVDTQKCFCFDPQNLEYFKAKAYIAIDRGSYDEAIEYISKSIELEPEDFALYRQRAQLFRLNEKFEKAIEDCDRAIELDEHSMVHCERARSHLSLKKYENVIDDCKVEIELSSVDNQESWVPYHLIGLAQIELNQLDEAVVSLSRSLEIQISKEAYQARARAYEKLGEEDKAKEDFEKAETTGDGDPGVL